ncbi:MAG: hypothetical protein CFE37_11375 [Alphaproteobacteria bacterium PA4]|nr:MAG: hypothetical protein CFE37_11375 [Alphaproteobacteria bacterium PA4]
MTMAGSNSGGTWSGRIARAAIAAAVLVLLAGPLIKFGVLGWQAGLAMFAISALLAGVGGLISLVAVLRKRGGLLVVLGAAAGLAALAVPVGIVVEARDKPRIHDITTDTVNPPAFVAITPELRGPNTNPVSYDPKIAPLQTAAFPQLKPLILPDAPAAAFDRALAAAKARKWTIVAADAAAGRIEATDVVPWWGFKDDVVVRLTPEGSGTRIDVRSKSRVGEGDLGVNAQRIKNYLAKIENP